MYAWGLLIAVALGAGTADFKLKVSPRNCDALVELSKETCETQKQSIENEYVSKLEEAERRHSQEIAILQKQVEDLQKGLRYNLAQCASTHLGHRDPSTGFVDERGTVRIYLEQTWVCGDIGILQFVVAPLLRDSVFRVARVQVLPPSGLPTEAAIVHSQWQEGAVKSAAVFDAPKLTQVKFDFRFVGNNGEVITASDVIIPLAGG